MAMPGAPVEIAIYEWSGARSQRVLLDWTRLETPADVTRAADVLRGVRRAKAHPSTAVGAAMRFGAVMLARTDCWALTLDLSGDGTSNSGVRPSVARAELEAAGITVNALVVGADDQGTGDRRQGEIAALSTWFREEVIIGPGAFVETALGYEDYRAAMTRKLLREVRGMVIGKVE